MPDDLYDTDILAWPDHAAALLDRIRAAQPPAQA